MDTEMRPRAAPKLASLPVPQLLALLGEGMTLVAEHIAALERAAEQQAGQEAPRGVEAIRVISEEEAGKFLILLDVARAAHGGAQTKADQLRRASSHLAKGIYSRAADIRPATFGELLAFADGLRRSHYLDGPNDVDWIFRNEIDSEREERLYVDYVETDDGDMWLSPARFDDIGFQHASGAVELVGALARAGFCESRVLALVADVWRDFAPAAGTHWQENERLTESTLEQLPAEAIDPAASGKDATRILGSWTFPLYHADLTPIPEDLERLRERQRDWSPYGEGDYYF
jgi:hypothetical protein